MDARALAGRLEAIEGRLAGSDAERRAAALCAAQLRDGGRRPRTQTLWMRPQREAPRAVYAALGLAGSLVAVGNPTVGLALIGGALLAVVLEAAGVPVLALLQTRRATQNVVAAPPAERGERVLLVLSAGADAPRDSLLGRLDRRVNRRLLPGPTGLLGLGLAAAAACAGARLAGAEGSAIGIAQLVPSALLILLLAGFLDAALAGPRRRAGAAGPAAALAAAAALDAQPPRALAVEVLIGGASEAGAHGMAAYVAARRRDIAPEDVVVVHLAAGTGPVRFVSHAGEHFPVGLHPRLAELAAALPGARRGVSRTRSAARVARGARWPAIGLEGEPRALAAAVVRLVSSIDAEVAQARETSRR
jgi:hypothetical protein